MELKNKEIRELCLIPTLRCNFKCKYCYVVQKKEDMCLTTGKKAIDLFLSTKGDEKNLIFFGGEPLLKKDLILKLIGYFKSNSRNIKHKEICIETNGFLLDKKLMEIFDKNNIILNISHDGVAHDKYRILKDNKPTKKRIDKILVSVLKYPHLRKRMIVSVTTTGKGLYESVAYLKNKGIKNIYISLIFKWWGKNDVKKFAEEINKIRVFSKKNRMNILNFPKKDSNHKKKEDSRFVCGIDHKILVRPDGSIVACKGLINSNNKIHYMGNVNRNICNTFFYEGKENEKVPFCLYFSEKNGEPLNRAELKTMITKNNLFKKITESKKEICFE